MLENRYLPSYEEICNKMYSLHLWSFGNSLTMKIRIYTFKARLGDKSYKSDLKVLSGMVHGQKKNESRITDILSLTSPPIPSAVGTSFLVSLLSRSKLKSCRREKNIT